VYAHIWAYGTFWHTGYGFKNLSVSNSWQKMHNFRALDCLNRTDITGVMNQNMYAHIWACWKCSNHFCTIILLPSDSWRKMDNFRVLDCLNWTKNDWKTLLNRKTLVRYSDTWLVGFLGTSALPLTAPRRLPMFTSSEPWCQPRTESLNGTYACWLI